MLLKNTRAQLEPEEQPLGNQRRMGFKPNRFAVLFSKADGLLQVTYHRLHKLREAPSNQQM